MLFSLKNRKKDEKKKNSNKMESPIDDLDGSPFRQSAAPQAPPRQRKTAGWSDDTPGRKTWLRKGSKHVFRESPKREVIIDNGADNVVDIPMLIEKEEELSPDVAQAPSLPVKRVVTYQELDSDLTKHAAFQSLDGIDLSLLTKHLLPEHTVKKEDETPWTWDTLFAEASSHFNLMYEYTVDSHTDDASLNDLVEKLV